MINYKQIIELIEGDDEKIQTRLCNMPLIFNNIKNSITFESGLCSL